MSLFTNLYEYSSMSYHICTKLSGILQYVSSYLINPAFDPANQDKLPNKPTLYVLAL